MIQNSRVNGGDIRDYGSFKDSLRAPIHRWFTYPAGYSHKLVESKIQEYRLTRESWIADPFVGTGTTSLVAKIMGVNSLGVEAHPFVHWVARTKLHLDYDHELLCKDIETVLKRAKSIKPLGNEWLREWPELVYKCFEKDTLWKLFALRQSIESQQTTEARRDLLKVALTATLRIVTSAGSGWPYIAPSKYAARRVQRDAYEEFTKRCTLMLQDLATVKDGGIPVAEHRLFNGDARKFSDYAEAETVDLVLTSPPYLNNYDYADRTRLETYFWGIYENWGEITSNVRDRLITAATTQIRRSELDAVRHCPNIEKTCKSTHGELVDAIDQLGELRSLKRGKKSYDLMVAGYFEDMLKVLREAHDLLKCGGRFVLVLGDSAPYGVHIPTDEIVSQLGRAIGFSDFTIEVIRTRGDKWAGNTQRHKVPLRESIVTLSK